jgi:hypothetical protein
MKPARVRLVAGLLAVAWPMAWTVAWGVAVILGVLGVAAVIVAAFDVAAFDVVPASRRGRRAAMAATVAAVLLSMLSHAGSVVLAAEGLFILGYQIAADLPALARADQVRWARRQVPSLAAGVVACGVIVAVLAVHPAASVWFTVGGLAAAVLAYRIALPGGPSRLEPGSMSSDVDPGSADGPTRSTGTSTAGRG